jgi:hypothetical protein
MTNWNSSFLQTWLSYSVLYLSQWKTKIWLKPKSTDIVDTSLVWILPPKCIWSSSLFLLPASSNLSPSVLLAFFHIGLHLAAKWFSKNKQPELVTLLLKPQRLCLGLRMKIPNFHVSFKSTYVMRPLFHLASPASCSLCRSQAWPLWVPCPYQAPSDCPYCSLCFYLPLWLANGHSHFRSSGKTPKV